ncbi:MAG: hypothetical protein JXB62_19380 [Pirellulales bacterium]|nr:hypothetical protein [Pirellulales bacterium]
MCRGMLTAVLAAGVGLWLGAREAAAQQVTVSTPYHSLNDSFFERTGVNWNFNFGNAAGGPSMVFGRPIPGVGNDPGAMMRNTLDVDDGRSGVFGMQAPGVFAPGAAVPFTQNSFGLGVPQFGGYDPSAGLSSGFAMRGGGFNGALNWAAGQGYRQSFVSQTPSVTLTNGMPGSISDTSQSPFVMGYIPIVGGFPVAPYPYLQMTYPGYTGGPFVAPQPAVNHRVEAMRQQLAQQREAAGGGAAPPAQPMAAGAAKAIEPAAVPPPGDRAAGRLADARLSSAGRAVPSVDEARRLRKLEQAAQDKEALVLFERGQTAEEAGKSNVAKTYYKMAAGRASDALRRQIEARLGALAAAETP